MCAWNEYIKTCQTHFQERSWREIFTNLYVELQWQLQETLHVLSQSKNKMSSLFRLSKFRLSLRRSYSNAGSPLGKRESALEERFILEHEKEVVAQLRKDLAEKERRLAEKLKKHEASEPAPAPAASAKPLQEEHIRLSPMGAAASSFGKREAAAEEQYFRRLEHDKIEHLKHPEKK